MIGAMTIDLLLIDSLTMLDRIIEFGPWWYALTALLCAIGGAVALASGTHKDHAKAGDDALPGAACIWQAFVLGAGGGLLLTGCCAPFLAGAAGLLASRGSNLPLAVALSFAVGHVTPPILLGFIARRASVLSLSLIPTEALQAIQGGVCFGCAAFFAILA